MSQYNHYMYSGPVEDNFGNCVDRYFKTETYAPTLQKAKSNISFQWKEKRNYPKNYKIYLTGTFTKE